MGSDDDSLVVVESYTVERPFLWVFFYNSKKYMETGLRRHRLAGNGPVIVDRRTGAIQFCASNRPAQDSINDYESKHGYPGTSASSLS